MKKLIKLFVIVLLPVLLLIGCGQNVGTNPEGSLGGGDQGYGEWSSNDCGCDSIRLNSVPANDRQQDNESDN